MQLVSQNSAGGTLTPKESGWRMGCADIPHSPLAILKLFISDRNFEKRPLVPRVVLGCPPPRRGINQTINHYLTVEPIATISEGCNSRNFPLGSETIRSMPCDSTPIILRGTKFSINATCFPVNSSGA